MVPDRKVVVEPFIYSLVILSLDETVRYQFLEECEQHVVATFVVVFNPTSQFLMVY